MAEANRVTWMSAFWALAPVALNAMALPSGRVMGCPESWNFALRSSPLFCALTVLHDIAMLGKALIVERSWAQGVRRWRDERFYDDRRLLDEESDTDGDDNDDDDLTNKGLAGVRKNKLMQLILFGFGALPQIVKIFLARGIPLTQTCCAAYLATYLLDQLLSYLSAKSSASSYSGLLGARAQRRSGTTWFYRFAVGTTWSTITTTTTCGLLCIIIIPEDRVQGGRTALGFLLLVAPVVGLLASLRSLNRTLYLWIAGSTTLLSFWLWLFVLPESPQKVYYILSAVTQALASFLLLRMWSLLDDEGYRASSTADATTIFVLASFVGAYLCYLSFFDPASTSKPAWTNKLG